MKLYLKISILLFCALLANISNASQSSYSHKKLTEKVHIVTKHFNDMANIGEANISFGVIKGKEGLLLINSMVAWDVSNFVTELKKISDLPVKYVLNNNYDGNNTELNAYFAAKGAQIISHKALKYSDVFTQKLIDDGFTMQFGGQTITAHHSQGHSFGQINIHLKEANVLFMADSYRSDWLTVFGPKGIDGHISGLKQALAIADENTLIVSGVVLKEKLFADVSDIKRQINSSQLFKSLIQKHTKKGLSPEQIATHQDITTFFETYYPKRKYHQWFVHRVRPAVNFHATPRFDATNKDKNALLGQYVSDNGKIFEIIKEGDDFIARSINHYMLPLKWTQEDTLLVTSSERDDKLLIKRNSDEEITHLRLSLDDNWKKKYMGAYVWTKL